MFRTHQQGGAERPGGEMSGHGGCGGHGRHDHGDRDGDRRRDALGNPEHLAAYLEKLESPERAEWQKPDEVVAALGLRTGGVAADAGAGPGYFALRLARAVGPSGRVYGIDAEPRMLELLAQRARDAGLAHVELVHTDGLPLPPAECDAILVVNAYHHFPDGPGVLRALAGRLAPTGRLAVVDFHPDTPVGPPPDHLISREAFLGGVTRAGLRVAREERFLPYQYFFFLER
jgi:ubiquinone/menaquinone biosynthesis C-methylase UbiE